MLDSLGAVQKVCLGKPLHPGVLNDDALMMIPTPWSIWKWYDDDIFVFSACLQTPLVNKIMMSW